MLRTSSFKTFRVIEIVDNENDQYWVGFDVGFRWFSTSPGTRSPVFPCPLLSSGIVLFQTNRIDTPHFDDQTFLIFLLGCLFVNDSISVKEFSSNSPQLTLTPSPYPPSPRAANYFWIILNNTSGTRNRSRRIYFNLSVICLLLTGQNYRIDSVFTHRLIRDRLIILSISRSINSIYDSWSLSADFWWHEFKVYVSASYLILGRACAPFYR